MPFLLVVSMLAVGGIVGLLLFNTSMQQASFAATVAAEPGRRPRGPAADACRWSSTSCATRRRSRSRPSGWGWCCPTSPAVLDLRTGKVLGTPTPATRLDPLRLLAPPPAKPAELDPPAHVTVVQPPAHAPARRDSSGNTARAIARPTAGTHGSNDRTSHTAHRHPLTSSRKQSDGPPRAPAAGLRSYAGPAQPPPGRPPLRRRRRRGRGAAQLRLRTGFVFIAVVLSFFGARLVQLQGVSPEKYATLAASRAAPSPWSCPPTAARSSTATASRSPTRSTAGWWSPTRR